MTRLELIQLLVGQARTNGFEFRKWYVGRLGIPWTSANDALALLSSQRRYYTLLFSHEFASTFWKSGERITFQVPQQTFQRVRPDGSVATVSRKGFTRRSSRDDSWRYHLREMALAEEPLRYMRRYLRVEDELDEGAEHEVAPAHHPHPAKKAQAQPKKTSTSLKSSPHPKHSASRSHP